LARGLQAARPAELAASVTLLADVLALQGKFREAVPLFEEILGLREQPKKAGDPAVARALAALALARLAAGDADGYRAAGAQLLDRFGATRYPTVAELVARTLALAADASAAAGRLVALAPPAVRGDPKQRPRLPTLAAAPYPAHPRPPRPARAHDARPR